MSKYVEFTTEEIDRAAHTDIKSILEAKGEKVIPSGTEWAWAEHDSVKFRGHVFYQHSTGEKGTAIDFLCAFFNMRFPDAVLTLLGDDYDGIELRRVRSVERKKIAFALPQRNRDMHRVYAYLMQERHIDSEVITYCVRQNILYESKQTHNAVFVGRDATGKPRAAHQRGTLTQCPYRGDVPGSEKDYFFNLTGSSSRVYVFEAPIDLLSFITLNKYSYWQQHNYIALGGLAIKALARFLLEHPDLMEIVFCVDNDFNAKKKDGTPDQNHGQVFANHYSQDYTKVGYKCSIKTPEQKDWNELLKQNPKLVLGNLDI